MSEEQSDQAKPDPFARMIEFYDTWTKSWAQVMSEAVASKEFADTMAEQMEGGLEAWSLLRRQIGEATEQYLQQVNMPTRKDVVTLAERLTQIEMTLDDLDAKLDEVLDSLRAKRETERQ